MSDWLQPALAASQRWLAYQQRAARLPGLQCAVMHRGAPAGEFAMGVRSLLTGERMTPDTRMRVASHSKTFTAVAIMRLVEAGRLRLDDSAGAYVSGLHADTAAATVRQLLSHTAGLTRDGLDAGQWQMRRPFLDEAELRRALADEPVIAANTRMKYSNHGFGLLGLIIEKVTGEAYGDFVSRDVVAGAGLGATSPDGPIAAGTPYAHGHGPAVLLGERFEIDNGCTTAALASATGFVSTAGDLARFFAQLSPAATSSLLSAQGRREMTRRHWRVPEMSAERHYGLGVMHGGADDGAWFGHGGAFPGCLSHTAVIPQKDIVISIIVNTVDLAPQALVDGMISILGAAESGGAPTAATAPWRGRFWSIWGAVDLLPVADRVLVMVPSLLSPLTDAVELTDVGDGSARIGKAHGMSSFGEGARLETDPAGQPTALWLGGTRLLPEAAMAAEIRQRFRTAAADG